MLKVGLTGNIAAGKSAVAGVWRSMGATVVDADELSRRAVEPGTPAHDAIAREWGPWVLEEGGALDRAALRQIVFADPDARARLEAIVHPAVAALRDEHFRQAQARGEKIVVADIPLLFEVGMADEFDVVVLVDAPEEVRLARIVADRGLDEDEARRMIATQMPSELKKARADVVIRNAGTLGDLQDAARDVWRQLERRAGGGG
ncbi:MAG TPA: dephospho-CoA kinase [Longimicrobium sp.]|jgi:dephospho-CoA kinase|uniref:dephospho-CoA kinase n=1 Tax=Longimicrobium sp. TaxID=2029185 RepID=UPI002ED81B5A